MPALVVPNAALLIAKGTNLGKPWVNVIGCSMPDPVLLDQTVVDELADAVEDLYEGIRLLLTVDWSFDELVVQDLRTATSPAWDASVTPVLGASTGIPVPANLAIVASHSTGLRGKSFRGRTYHNGFRVDSMAANGTLNEGDRSTIAAAWDTFRTSLAAAGPGGFEHAVVSRSLLVATPVVETTVDDHYDHQDRRKLV